LVVIVFTDYTISWWDQLVKSRRHKREMPIEVWKKIKAITRKIFVLTHNYKEIYNKLQTLSQDSKSVVEYFKEIKVVMIRVNIF
jgi:hypothetical protein